jgi:hypothetical protein
MILKNLCFYAIVLKSLKKFRGLGLTPLIVCNRSLTLSHYLQDAKTA